MDPETAKAYGIIDEVLTRDALNQPG
jgi:ATP-dependent protease ClpP protease subunit